MIPSVFCLSPVGTGAEQVKTGDALQIGSFPLKLCVRFCSIHVMCSCWISIDLHSSILLLTRLS